MKIILVDSNWKRFLPLTFTRPVSYLRCGILKIHEKWENIFSTESTSVSEDYLNIKYFQEFEGDVLIINSKFLPNSDLITAINSLKNGESLFANEGWIAIKSNNGFDKEKLNELHSVEYSGRVSSLNNWWDLYLQNGEEIKKDFELITKGRVSKKISDSNTLIGNLSNLFIEEGAYIEGSILNTLQGPIYIGKDVEVMEGSLIRGGFSALDGTKVKMGAKIYGPTSVGPKCRVGGEVKNCVIQGYSNKSHDGYLGNSVLGEWVNLGADTNCSNLKNTFSIAKVWDYESQSLEATGETFIGSCFGDYSKTGINTMLNTGTVIGVNSNVFGSGFPPKYIPSFSWGKEDRYQFERAWLVNANIAEMANEHLVEKDKEILKDVHTNSIEIFNHAS